MADQIFTQRFSKNYDLLQGVEINTINDDEAIIDKEMCMKLESIFGKPLIAQVEGLHYQFKPTMSVPACSVAVPEHNHQDPESFLIRL